MLRRSFFMLANFTPVFMPALSPSMESGTIVEWKKKVGDLVKENEVFCTVQTDKAVVDYTNTFEAGYLAKVFRQNGETVTVTQTIAVMVDDKEDLANADEFVPEGEATALAPPASAEPQPTNSSGSNGQPPDDVNLTPVFMPALSPSMESGTIVEWKKKVGDLVKENEVFCTVQTDKAVVDYTNTFEAGYLAKVFRQNGETVTVTQTIAVMVEHPDDIPKLADYNPDGAAPSKANTPATIIPAAAPASSSFSGLKRYGSSLEKAIAASGPGVMRIAACLEHGTLESITPSGKDGRFLKSDFIGQPGFNYDDASPPLSSAATSSTVRGAVGGASATPQSKAGGGTEPATASVVVKTYPVVNFKASDTAVLQQLLRTMSVPKRKDAKGSN